MLILTAKDIQTVYTMSDAIRADKEALKLYSQGLADVPLRINFDSKKGQHLLMPAHIKNADICGIKIASVYPDNPKLGKPSVPAQVILLAPDTGEVCAVIDGTYLTQLRTGAVQGAATDLLAIKKAKHAVLIGTGGQAETQLEAMLTARKLISVAIYDMNSEKAHRFVANMQLKFSHFNCHFYVSPDLDEDIANADIITTVTTAKEATFNGERIKPGAHINGVGAYTPMMIEMPTQAITKAEIRVVDTKDGVFCEAGDIIRPINEGLVSQADFIELGELILSPEKGRQNEQQITLFKTVGSAVLDVYVGYDIYLKAKQAGIGQLI